MRIFFEELEILRGQAKTMHFSFSFPEVLEENRDVLQFSTVQFSGEARYTAGLVEVKGTIQFKAAFTCARCLQTFEQAYEVPFFERFVRANDGLVMDEGEERIHKIPNESFDITPYCKEEIFLGLPYIPICNPECKGLCPQCGSNLNEHECGCNTERIDPRFADLAKLFNQEQDS